MKNVSDFLNKYLVYAIYIFLFVSIINGCNGCRNNKETERLRKEVDSLNTKIGYLNANSYTKEELNVRMSIEGYEVSKRMLYDQNAIIRTTVRPDDRMNDYDQKIKALNEKLK